MALILADSSVWIDFFRKNNSSSAKKLAYYLSLDRICVTHIIRVEIISGARAEKEFNQLKNNLSALPILDEPPGFWDSIALYRFQLARRGVQISITDLSIAVLASHYRCPLLTKDKEFIQISLVLPLNLMV